MAIIPNKLFFFFLLSYLVLFVGCSAKSSQGAIKEAYMPIECNVTIPDKPAFDPLNPRKFKRFNYLLHTNRRFIKRLCKWTI